MVLQNLNVWNGPGWGPDGRTAYFNDSPTGAVASFDYGPEGLSLGTRARGRLAVRGEARCAGLPPLGYRG